jgi:protein SCO1/2
MMSKKTVTISIVAIVTGVVIALFGPLIFQAPYTFQGALIDPPIPAADFTLLDAEGRPFTLNEQRGKVVLIFFGYTSCPDVCPTTLVDFKRVRAQLGDAASDVQFVFITVDPERDTLERIAQYVPAFHPSFIGLTGSQTELEAVYDDYGIFVEKEDTGSSAGYLVSHTARIYVVDQDGNLRLTFPFGKEAEAMAQDIAYLVNSSETR